MKLLVGLTGGLASGKSTVARRLREAGFRVVDADRLVAELYRPGGPGTAAVAALFGAAALTPAGGVDHRFVAERVFSDPASRRRLERAIHPLVRQRFREIAAAADESVVVLEATLLVEAGYAPDFDLVVAVEADPEVRFRRATERGMAPAEARRRLDAQGDGAARRAAAQRVVRNDGTREELDAGTDELIAELRRRVEATPAPASGSPGGGA